MNFCEISVVKQLQQSSIDNGVTIQDVINEASKVSGGINSPDTSMHTWLTKLANIQINTLAPFSRRDIRNLFKNENGKTNYILYGKVLRRIRETVVSLITRSDINNAIDSYIFRAKSLHKYDKPNSNVYHLYKTLNDIKNNGDSTSIVDYLLINHLPELCSTILSDVLEYNPSTNTYNIKSSQHIRQDWNSEREGEQEPDNNSILKLMLEVTPLLYQDGTTYKFIPNSMKISQSHFNVAINDEIEKMSLDDHKKFANNPYYIIEYLKNKYLRNVTHVSPTNVIMHSFVTKWLRNVPIDKNYKQTLGTSVIDILVTAFEKYRLNAYVETNTDGSEQIISAKIDSSSKTYGEVTDRISMDTQTSMPKITQICSRSGDGKFVLNDLNTVNIKLLTSIIKYYFGYNAFITENTKYNFFNGLKVIVDYMNSSYNSFTNYLDQDTNNKGIIISTMNYSNLYNPYVISGTKKSKAGKQLPVISVKSVGNSIKEIIYRTEQKIKNLHDISDNVFNRTGYYQTVPVQLHTSLYNNTIDYISDEDKIFNGTIYQASLSDAKNINIKEPSDFSTPESFMVAWSDWQSRKNGTIRIQAITPSDKPKIPRFEFNWTALLKCFGDGLKLNHVKIMNEMCSIYKQQWLNTMLDLNMILDLNLEIEGDIKKYSIDELRKLEQTINDKISSYTTDQLYQATHDFNTKYNTNKNIALYHDFVKTDDGRIIVSPYHSQATNLWNVDEQGKYSEEFKQLVRQTFNNVKSLVPNLKVTLDDNKTIEISELWDDKGNLKLKALKTDLFEYFLVKNILSENILINTVGSPLAHKGSGETFDKLDSAKHLTMVKRMVALTTTMHACSRNNISGLPNKIKTMTISNPHINMFTYSGNSTDGKSSIDTLKTSDGTMYCPGYISRLLKQSIADVKPKGMDQKLILHSQDSEKASSYLLKLANFVIDNNYLRTFSDPNLSKLGARDPMMYIKMSLDQTKLRPESFTEKGLVDFNGNLLLDNILYKVGDEIRQIIGIHYDLTTDTLIISEKTSSGISSKSVDNNLFSLFEAIGGAYTCDKYGNYNEKSQEFIAQLLINVGIKNPGIDKVTDATQVDQYLKNDIIHYFPTEEGSKSLKTPTVNWENAINDPRKRWTISMDIDYFGIQLDPDHDADSGEIKEITQLMSFISKKMRTPELTSRIYNNLVSLMDILLEKYTIDFDMLEDSTYKSDMKAKSMKIFDKMLKRIFADPELDVKGLANETAKELKNIAELHMPFSDHQVLPKAHTTIGSMFRKYISRTWNGRADVLVPAYNQAMIYEDKDGNTYMYSDLRENQLRQDKLRNDVMNASPIGKYEAEYGKNYYVYDTNGLNPLEPTIITIDSWEKLLNVSSDIDNGLNYIPAYDLPRNLADASIILHINDGEQVHNVNLYYLEVLSNLIKNINREESAKDYQTFLNALYSNDLIILKRFLASFGFKDIVEVTWTNKPQETLTTNNYASSFGINNMTYSEIQEQKENYFYNHLVDTFSYPINVNSNALCTLYSSSGTPTVLCDNDFIITSDYTEFTPIVNDEGFIVDETNKQIYQYIPGAVYYKSNDFGYTMIQLPQDLDFEILGNFFSSGHFIFYNHDSKLSDEIYKYIKPNKITKLPVTEREKETVFKRIAQKQYESWVKSNLQISSRIPAQDISFAAICKTVGYLPYDNNIRMVPNSHVYIQGSDFDIDKVTSIMAALDNNGLYKSNRHDVIIGNFDENTLTEIDEQINIQIANILIKDDVTNDDISNLYETIREHLNVSDLKLSESYIINAMMIQERDDAFYFNHKPNIRLIKNFLNTVRKDFIDLTSIELAKGNYADATQNSILENIMEIYRDPRTWADQFTPTTMEPVKQALNHITTRENSNYKKELRSHWDVTTDVFVNQTTIVGKKDIGISAVAQKAFFALGYYYEMKKQMKQSIINLNVLNLYGEPFISFGFAGTDLDRHSISTLIDTIQSTWNTSNNGLYTTTINGFEVFAEIKKDQHYPMLSIGLNPNELKKVIPGQWTDYDLTFVNSSIISASTDNAKEMIMDAINATPEVLPAYEYLLSVGVPLTKSAEILTHPIIKELIILSRGNLFDNAIGNRTSHLFTNDYKNILKQRIDSDEVDKVWSTLEMIFKGADELTVLGQALGINGGFKVDLGEATMIELKLSKHYHNLLKHKTLNEGEFKNLNLKKFLFDNSGDYSQKAINTYEQYKSTYNIYDVLYTVPHFRSMLKIPMLFQEHMSLISKDCEHMHLIGSYLNKDYKIDVLTLRTLIRAINDVKVRDFFFLHPFSFYAPKLYNSRGITNGESGNITTANSNGLATLKPTIEDHIIPLLKEKYPDNVFVANLIPKTIFDTLLQQRVRFWGLPVDLADSQYEDFSAIITEEFLKIANDEINGHKIYEWMQAYDILINKSTLAKNSLSLLFTQTINLHNNNVYTQWIKFVNEYDNRLTTYSVYDNTWKNLPKLDARKTSYEEDPDYTNEFEDLKPNTYRYWPFFSSVNQELKVLIDDDKLLRLFRNNKLLIINC